MEGPYSHHAKMGQKRGSCEPNATNLTVDSNKIIYNTAQQLNYRKINHHIVGGEERSGDSSFASPFSVKQTLVKHQ